MVSCLIAILNRYITNQSFYDSQSSFLIFGDPNVEFLIKSVSQARTDCNFGLNGFSNYL